MKYKELYKELANRLNELGCFICDVDVLGHCKHTQKSKAFIYIKPSLNFKHKYFVLAHEAGHLFYMKNKNFVWSEKARNEQKANEFALEFLSFNDIESNEYIDFYNQAKIKIKNRKKAWFEI